MDYVGDGKVLMQTPDGLWVDDHEIHSFSCMVGGVHLEANWSPTGVCGGV